MALWATDGWFRETKKEDSKINEKYQVLGEWEEARVRSLQPAKMGFYGSHTSEHGQAQAEDSYFIIVTVVK